MKEKKNMQKRVVCITMDEKIWNKAKQIAKTQNRTLSNFLSYLVIKEENN